MYKCVLSINYVLELNTSYYLDVQIICLKTVLGLLSNESCLHPSETKILVKIEPGFYVV